MFRTITCLAAAAILTTGAVAAMAEDVSHDDYRVTINKAGDYCVHMPAITGQYMGQIECRPADEWAKRGVNFTRK